MQALQERWEAKLAREGLSPLDGDRRPAALQARGIRRGARTFKGWAYKMSIRAGRLSRRGDGSRLVADIDVRAAAAAQYLAWAEAVAARHEFASDAQREAWSLHAAGHSHNQISRLLEMRRRTVTAHVSTVKLAAGGAPPNPWRKSGKDTNMATAQERANGQTQALREAAGGDIPRPRQPVYTYSRILMREPIEIRGRAARHDRLLDVEGRPHAGGIDVMIGPEDFPGTQVEHQVITIPWWRIRQADRSGE